MSKFLISISCCVDFLVVVKMTTLGGGGGGWRFLWIFLGGSLRILTILWVIF